MSSMRPEHPPAPASTFDHPVRYPTNSVVGVIDSREQLDRLVGALLGGAFLRSELEVATGRSMADAMHASTGRTWLAALAIRIADRIGAQDEEMEFKHHYEQAMRDGRFVVMVKAPTEERKQRATGMLREHGAHAVSFHGVFTIEGAVPDWEA